MLSLDHFNRLYSLLRFVDPNTHQALANKLTYKPSLTMLAFDTILKAFTPK